MIPKTKWTVIADGWHSYTDDDHEMAIIVRNQCDKLIEAAKDLLPGGEVSLDIYLSEDIKQSTPPVAQEQE